MPHRLTKLQPRHNLAIHMRIDGRAPDEIADALGVKLRTVYLWFSDPLVKNALEESQDRMRERFTEKILEAALAGAQALANLTTQPIEGPITVEQQMEAVNMLFERLPKSLFEFPDVRGFDEELTRKIDRLTPAERQQVGREVAKDLLGVTEDELRGLRANPPPRKLPAEGT